MENVKNKNYDWIDIAKGIGIILVIWGHVILEGPAYNFIYAFHMPLFFLMSGLLFNERKHKNFKEFFIKRAKTLLIPYVIYSLITYTYWVLIENRLVENSRNIFQPFLQIFIAQGSGGYMLHNIPLWFVTCLFVLEMLYFWINKYFKKYKLYIIVMVLGILGCGMTLNNNFFNFTKLFWSIEVALIALPFYMIGNQLSKKLGKDNIDKIVINNKVKSIIALMLCSIGISISSNMNPDVSMGTDYIGNWLLFYINALIGIAIVFIISIFIKNNKLLQFLGKNSFFIMATHFPIRKPIVIIIALIFSTTSANIYKSIWLSLIVTLITVAVEIALILVLDKVKKIIKEKKWKQKKEY